MIERFQGDDGRRRLTSALLEHRLVGNQPDLASTLVDAGELIEVENGERFIVQGDFTTDVFLIVSGSVVVSVNSKVVARRAAGEHVGEMSAIEPTRPRAATIAAAEITVLLKISESSFVEAANSFPRMWRIIASVLARRLEERNRLITATREKVKVFLISSVEAIPIADLIVQHFEHDPFLTVAWQHGVFKASNYTLDDLERQLDDSDFAIAIAHGDDIVITRDREWPTVRDNVMFELGLFMGRLGRARTFLLEPRSRDLKLPSDFAGLTTVPYRYEKSKDALAMMAPTCARLRSLILEAGPR
ncbi:TIR domain-containing protein [Tahibacter sp.]|uniref:TIR domain-containing protein n=1 Tax=Tahibacter sp. TaxID=2056211 RepID=UPI0028C4A934|nr:TIR domain-containing protein [Tahibacter sp.]